MLMFRSPGWALKKRQLKAGYAHKLHISATAGSMISTDKNPQKMNKTSHLGGPKGEETN